MATAYEVTLMGTLVTEQVINRLGFVSNIDDVGSTSASALLQALGYLPADPETPEAFSFFVAFLAAQTASYQLDEILVRNLFSVTDFITRGTDVARGYTSGVHLTRAGRDIDAHRAVDAVLFYDVAGASSRTDTAIYAISWVGQTLGLGRIGEFYHQAGDPP